MSRIIAAGLGEEWRAGMTSGCKFSWRQAVISDNMPGDLLMSYDPGLAERVRETVAGLEGITERKMFGGLAFMSDGRMFVGILGSSLMARVGPGFYEAALALAHVRKMDFTGRPMKGYVFVDAPGLTSDESLEGWVSRSLEFVSNLPD